MMLGFGLDLKFDCSGTTCDLTVSKVGYGICHPVSASHVLVSIQAMQAHEFTGEVCGLLHALCQQEAHTCAHTLKSAATS